MTKNACTLAQPTSIFVISLPRSSERRHAMTEQMLRLELPFEFVDAVDGHHLTTEQRTLVAENILRNSLTPSQSILTPGEIGCALSHALLYQKILDENLPAAYILEDDALVGTTFARLVKQAVLERQPQIELALLSCWHTRLWLRWRLPLGQGLYACRPTLRPTSASAYYLTQAAVARLRLATSPIATVADWPIPIQQEATTYVVHPQPATSPYALVHQSLLETERAEKFCHILPAIDQWPLPQRWLGRLACLTLLPCLFWPQTFGSLTAFIALLQRVVLLVISYPVTLGLKLQLDD